MSQKENTHENEMNGAEAIIHYLESIGVDTIFGYPGGANLPIYDALRGSSIKHVLSRHEQGAAHMADGYARVAKKPGVCLATSGPGATNLVTGLANAMLDSIPVVALTGQIVRDQIGTDAFQEVDCLNITMPVTKHNELVTDEKCLLPALQAAFHIADTGRKGPVLLDVPKDVLSAKFPYNMDDQYVLKGYNPTTIGNIGQIKRAMKALNKAERPVILYGGGVDLANAIPEFNEFVRKLQIPIVRTLMGTGIFPDDDPLYIGMVGTHGNTMANRIVQKKADLIFAIGTRLGDRAVMKKDLFARNAKIIHLDIDPAEIGKSIPVDIPIVGDLKLVLANMNERLDQIDTEPAPPWIVDETRKNMLSTRDSASILEDVFSELSSIPMKLNISTDVGRHQMWANHFCRNMNQLPLITSGGLGTMGFGLPAAIGAWFAEPETPVVSLSGDGSFMMNMQEFVVAVEHNVPLTVVLLNDSRLGMIRELQTAAYKKRYTTHDFQKTIDFVKLAEAMGGVGETVISLEQIGPALKKAINSGKQTLINFDIPKLARSSGLALTPKAS